MKHGLINSKHLPDNKVINKHFAPIALTSTLEKTLNCKRSWSVINYALQGTTGINYLN